MKTFFLIVLCSIGMLTDILEISLVCALLVLLLSVKLSAKFENTKN